MLKLVVILSLCFLSSASFAQSGRRVVTDDGPGFNDRNVQEASGIWWQNFFGGDDLRNDGVVSGGRHWFAMQLGTSFISKDNVELLYSENGNIQVMDKSSGQKGLLELFAGADLVSAAPGSYLSSIGTPGDGLGYRLGEVFDASASRLEPDPAGGYQAFNVRTSPDGTGLLRRYTWFGLTEGSDICNQAGIQLVVSGGLNTFAGTQCADYLTRARYFGQVEFVDVGTAEDGDFDIFVGLGLGNFPNIFYCPDGSRLCDGNVNGFPTGATGGGFDFGGQRYVYTASEVLNRENFSHFQFRSGIGCAVASNGICIPLSDLDGSTGSVPIPGVLLLLLIGGSGLSMLRTDKKRLNTCGAE
jgi:hypothetical protein